MKNCKTHEINLLFFVQARASRPAAAAGAGRRARAGASRDHWWALMIIDHSQIYGILGAFQGIFSALTVFSVGTHPGLPKHCKTQ